MSKLTALSVVVVTSLIPATPEGDAGAGTVKPAPAAIAFASHRDGNWEIYLSGPDGRGQMRLTRRNRHTRFPLWSPDRSRIAFASQRGDPEGGWDLSVMNADGTNARLLSPLLVAKSNRGWSPDGTRIVFTGTTDGNLDLYVVEVSSGRVSRLTASAGTDRDPSWSPDGALIAFSSERDGNREIYVMRANGSDVRRMTTDTASDASPVWSPDGMGILFVSGRGGTPELYLMRRDGTGLERLTRDAHSSSDAPRFSPDGSRIAFQIADRGRYDIGLLRLRDRQQRVLVGTPHQDGSYTWSSNGRQLAYISGPGGAETLHVVDVETGRTRQLTTTWSLTPDWVR